MTEKTLFSERIAEMSAGWLDRLATEQLAEVIKAVKVTGKKGKITLTLDICPRNTLDGDIVIIKPTLNNKVPKVGADPEVYRTFEDGDMEMIPHGDDGLEDDEKPGGNVTPIRKKR